MSGLLFPGEEDFFLARGSDFPILCTKINGFSLILFYSTNCVYCKKLIPIFRKLPEKVGGCTFAMVNVAQARNILQQSKKTKSPIEYVPYIIFYVNNKPYMSYNGPASMEEIRSFVVEVANNVQNKQTFAPDRVKHADRDIPEYTTLGKPLCGDDERCYLNYDDAYPEEAPGTNAPSERQSSATHKGQYLGYESAYNTETSDPNKQLREEYLQAQQQYPQQQQMRPPRQQQMRPPQQQYPQQQQMRPPQQQYPQQQQMRPPQQQMRPPQQQYPQQQQMRPPQQQYPQQQMRQTQPGGNFMMPHNSRNARKAQYGRGSY